MQSHRLALVVLVIGSALPAVPAMAAKAKPPCNLITDREGDGTINPTGLSSPSLDILSADISSGPREVTATLRLKSAAVENDNFIRGGANWNFNVTVGGTNYSFYARWPSAVRLDPPALYGGLTSGNQEASPAATFRREGNNFFWTVSRAAMPGLKKPKTTNIVVNGSSSGANSLGADSAPAKPDTKYLDMSPSCLPSK